VPIDEKQKTVNARDLWEFLEAKTRFNDWIIARIDEYEFQEDRDYTCFTENSVKPQGGRPSKEYHISIHMANELWIARENLKKPGARTDLSEKSERLHTWTGYCQDVGIGYSTAQRWLNNWFPEALTLEKKPF